MKTIAVTVPEELDHRAAVEARRRGISKSELIRRGLAAVLPAPTAADTEADPWVTLAGFGSHELVVVPGEIDRVLYGS